MLFLTIIILAFGIGSDGEPAGAGASATPISVRLSNPLRVVSN